MAKDVLERLSRRLKKLIKSARVVSSDDSGDYPVIEVTYFGIIRRRVLLLSPYGIWGLVPGGSLATVFNINAAESNQGAVANDYPSRPVKNKKPGEVVVGNSLTAAYILFREDGGMDIRATGSVDLTADGDVNVIAPNVNVTATGEIDFTAPQINLNGTVTVGDLDITGDLDVTGTNMTHNGTNVGDSHVHPITSGSSAPGPTGGPQ